jgi:hypothetical protein
MHCPPTRQKVRPLVRLVGSAMAAATTALAEHPIDFAGGSAMVIPGAISRYRLVLDSIPNI